MISPDAIEFFHSVNPEMEADYCKPTYDALPAAELDPALTLQDDRMNLFSFMCESRIFHGQ